MSRVVDAGTHGQVLPEVGDPLKRTSAWMAHQVTDADRRATVPAFRQIAGRLLVVPAEKREYA